MMQELQEIASSLEIMGKAFVDIGKKMKCIKVRAQGDKFKKKRVPTAYNCFVKSQVRKGANMKDVMSTLGAKWKELSADEKQVYVDQSKVSMGDDDEPAVVEKPVVTQPVASSSKDSKKPAKVEKKETKKKAVAKKAVVSDDGESENESGSDDDE